MTALREVLSAHMPLILIGKLYQVCAWRLNFLPSAGLSLSIPDQQSVLARLLHGPQSTPTPGGNKECHSIGQRRMFSSVPIIIPLMIVIERPQDPPSSRLSRMPD